MNFLQNIGIVPLDDAEVALNSEPTVQDEMIIQNVTRRSFIKNTAIASSSLVIGIQLSSASAFSKNSNKSLFDPDVFISMDKAGTVTIMSHRSEMGQGIKSSLPMLVADEMECDWDRVVVKQALGDSKYGSQNTDGSRSVRRFYFRLKEAGATARTMLQNAAAKVWKVKPSDVTIYNHQAKLKDSSQVLDFSDLVEIAATLPIPDKATLKIKTESEHRYVGKDNM